MSPIFSPEMRQLSVSLAGVEARGFIFGPPIALAIGAKFVPLRKPGKLPGIFIFISTYHTVPAQSCVLEAVKFYMNKALFDGR